MRTKYLVIYDVDGDIVTRIVNMSFAEFSQLSFKMNVCSIIALDSINDVKKASFQDIMDMEDEDL